MSQPANRRLVTEAALAPALEQAEAASTAASQAQQTADALVPRMDQIETMAGLAPGEVTDERTANLIARADTSTRNALNAATAQAIDAIPGPTVAQAVARKLRGKKVAVVLRHDDVQASALDYLPLYEQHGVKASWYVAVNQIGTIARGYQMATTAQLQSLADDGHEIGSHTMDHFYFATSTEAERRAQLEDSKAALEKMVGGGYVCETFAYPGNEAYNRNLEVLDYYLLGTSGVDTTGTAGTTNTAGTIDLSHHRAEYPDPIIGATPAETTTKARAWINAQKSRTGVTVFTLQTHNTAEVSLASMSALLDVIADDPEVTTLTMRELAHYVREYSTTEDGRIYAGSNYTGGWRTRFRAVAHSAGGKIIERLGAFGKALRVYVDGVEVATLDKELNILTPGVSRLNEGHKLALYQPGNTSYAEVAMNGSGILDFFLSATAQSIRMRGRMVVWAAGKALSATATSGLETFYADTTRNTIYMRPATTLPEGAAQSGELCNVNGTIYVCTAGGATPTWVKVGTQA